MPRYNLVTILACLSLTACAQPDRGRCLASHRVAMATRLQPMVVGKVTILVTNITPAHDKCDRWEFPDGKV